MKATTAQPLRLCEPAPRTYRGAERHGRALLLIVVAAFSSACDAPRDEKRDPKAAKAARKHTARTNKNEQGNDHKEAKADAQKEDGETGEPPPGPEREHGSWEADFESWVASAGKLPQAEIGQGPESRPREISSIAVLQPNYAVLWPGSLIMGRSTLAGKLAPVTVGGRAPIKIVIKGISGGTETTETVAEPTLSSLDTAVGRLVQRQLKAGASAVPRVRFNKTEVHSLEQSMSEMKARAGWIGGGVKAQIEAAAQSRCSTFLVRFSQVNYTIVVELVPGAASFFKNEAAAKKARKRAEKAAEQPNPITYVSAVDYGRDLYVLVSANEDASRLESKIDATFSAIAAKGGLSVATSHLESLKQTRITGFGVGTSVKRAAPILLGDLEKIGRFIMDGAAWGPKSPGAPIAYKTRYLDGSPAHLNFLTHYEPRTSGALVTSLKFTFRTGPDNKDHHTQVYVKVESPDGIHYDGKIGDRRGYVEAWEVGSRTYGIKLDKPIRESQLARTEAVVTHKSGRNHSPAWKFKTEVVGIFNGNKKNTATLVPARKMMVIDHDIPIFEAPTGLFNRPAVASKELCR